MKKLVSLALVLFISAAIYAQEFAKECYAIFSGHPKTLVQSMYINGNYQGDMTTTFDYDGKVTSIYDGVNEIKMRWSDDGKSVTTSLLFNGEHMNSAIITISCFNRKAIELSMPDGTNLSYYFEDNGRIIEKDIISGNQKYSEIYAYRQPSDIYPHTIKQINGNQATTTYIEIEDIDVYGNALKITQSANGMEMCSKRTIEYY